MVNEDIGLFLERVLHCPNNTKGDSPKIAGCMDMMRVQGRWGPAARLAWVRTVLTAATDAAGGEQLSKSAPNTFPAPAFWDIWGNYLDKMWSGHINNIIKPINPSKFDPSKKFSYSIEKPGVDQFIAFLVNNLTNNHEKDDNTVQALGVSGWPLLQLQSFLYHCVRGFLRADLYNALTELLSRAEGSFGIQAHCTLEPGVVVIASKGQPMSIAFDPLRPVVLFASEAEALAVPVYKSGKWLPERIDLDSHGEIFRLGDPRGLNEGTYSTGRTSVKKKESKKKKAPVVPRSILLDCGVEIRSYSLVTCMESTAEALSNRSVTINHAPLPYDPKVDLVAADLKVTTAVIDAIDEGK